MNEQPSNILIKIDDKERMIATEYDAPDSVPVTLSYLPPEDYEWLTTPDEPTEEMKRADVAHVFALFFVVTLCILFGLGVIIGKVL